MGHLDLFTIHAEHSMLLGTLTLLTAINSLVHRGERGTRWFPLFTFAAFVGAVLVCLRGTAPELFSIVGAAFLFAIAYLFLQLAFGAFYGDGRPTLALHLLCLVLIGVALLPWGGQMPGTALRMALYSGSLAAQLALSTAFLLRNFRRSPTSVRWATGTMAGILSLLCATNLFRAVIFFLHGAAVSEPRSEARLTLTMLVTSVLQGAATVAFVWMTAARLHDELRLEATTDPLTRLLNRRALGQWAEREIAVSRRNGWPLSAILIDLDEFKGINDRSGHHCGDAVLLGVAELLSASLRPGDQLGRLGGDEFVLLLPRTPEEVALGLAEALRERLESLTFPYKDVRHGVRGSFGIAELGGVSLTWEQLMERCDVALYNAKAMGGNCVLVH